MTVSPWDADIRAIQQSDRVPTPVTVERTEWSSWRFDPRGWYMINQIATTSRDPTGWSRALTDRNRSEDQPVSRHDLLGQRDLQTQPGPIINSAQIPT